LKEERERELKSSRGDEGNGYNLQQRRKEGMREAEEEGGRTQA